jgi:hypothetical protein
MIAVTGEALIDLVTDSDGRIAARTGGGRSPPPGPLAHFGWFRAPVRGSLRPPATGQPETDGGRWPCPG